MRILHSRGVKRARALRSITAFITRVAHARTLIHNPSISTRPYLWFTPLWELALHTGFCISPVQFVVFHHRNAATFPLFCDCASIQLVTTRSFNESWDSMMLAQLALPHILGRHPQRVSDAIDAQLRTEKDELKKRRQSRPDIKLLLLGQAGSGKSTLLKQFQVSDFVSQLSPKLTVLQLYYAPDLLDTQRSAWRPVVYFNVVKAVAHILTCLEDLGYFAPSDRERSVSTSTTAGGPADSGSGSAQAQAASRYGSLFEVRRPSQTSGTTR